MESAKRKMCFKGTADLLIIDDGRDEKIDTAIREGLLAGGGLGILKDEGHIGEYALIPVRMAKLGTGSRSRCRIEALVSMNVALSSS